jgi:K+-sensing histidine kinase KdpD
MRDDLMKMIVHDLKTPLTAVLATTEMLRDGDFGPVSDRQSSALSDCESKAEDLLALIDDLLEVWRLEEASITLDLQPIAPAALFAELLHEWNLRFKQESASAMVDVSEDAPIFEADKALLMRVLGNLVQNSLTHTATSVQLQFGAKRDGDGVLLTVADNGPGIPAEYHELIFRKFERVKNPSIPRTRSSGLGLAFCKLVIDAHGGRIWVRSPGEGQGSAFHMYLPLHPPSREVKVSSGGLAIG